MQLDAKWTRVIAAVWHVYNSSRPPGDNQRPRLTNATNEDDEARVWRRLSQLSRTAHESHATPDAVDFLLIANQ